MKPITTQEIQELADQFSLPVSRVHALIEVESGGIGFATDTGKIIIQFEPKWFIRKTHYTPSGLWSLNGVERQSKEWIAFSDAFAKNPNAAMEATSVGMMQVMGFHWAELGFKSVGEMYDFAKKSEKNQVELGLRFIQTNSKLYHALVIGDFPTVAYYYNGENYKINNYDVKLAKADKKYS